MSEPENIRAIRGVRDILPPQTALWQFVEDAARTVFKKYHFQEIRLPSVERARLFERSVGQETDIVSKELFTWVDSPMASRAIRKVRAVAGRTRTVASDKDSDTRHELEAQIADGAFDKLTKQSRVALRPEATASVVRAFIEHDMHTWPGPVKLYYMGSMFRRERPQKGRYREFYQIGAEVLGTGISFATDAEVIAMVSDFLDLCDVQNRDLYINSIGCQQCRPQFITLLKSELYKVRDQLSEDSRHRIETNPLRVFDSKVPTEQDVIARLPKILDHLCEDCRNDFESLKSVLHARSIRFEINPMLVRGLDYYTRTTFEITVRGLGAQNAICGGGRYERLAQVLGGRKYAAIKGVGFALGEDRVIDALKATQKLSEVWQGVDVFVAWIGEDAVTTALGLAKRLREANHIVEIQYEPLRLKQSLGLADRHGAKYALIVGEEEVASGAYTLRRLSDGFQQKLSESALLDHLEEKPRSS